MDDRDPGVDHPELDISDEEYTDLVNTLRTRHMSRPLQPTIDTCSICGQVITTSQRFYRDDVRRGDPTHTLPESLPLVGRLRYRWVHVDCVNRQMQEELDEGINS